MSTDAVSALVHLERDGGVVTVTLNRPQALNALSTGLRAAITRTFRTLQEDDTVEVVVLTGAGRAFCAGLDLKELGGERAADPEIDARSLDAYQAMRDFDRPIIGAINGVAITGGFELALACDLLLATPDTRFADTHARVGVVPGWGLSQRLPRLIGPLRAKELSLTGNFLDAETAERWGLVNRVVAADQLLPVAQALARDICSTDRRTREEIHRLIDAGWETTLREGLEQEERASRRHSLEHVSAEAVRSRREAIQKRGRTQQK